MPQLILTISDTLAQTLASLEDLDGQTADQRYTKYHNDIMQNEAKLDLSRPARVNARLAEMAEDAADAKQKRKAAKKAEREAQAADLPVVTEGISVEAGGAA